MNNEDFLNKEEAAEILATVLQQKRSFKQALKLRKDKELSRGYGKRFNVPVNGGNRGKPSGSNRYSVSIEEVRKRTKCWNCDQIGHRGHECPQCTKREKSDGSKVNAAHHLEKLEDTNEAFFVGSLTLEPETPRPVNNRVAFVEEPNCRSHRTLHSPKFVRYTR